MRVRFENESSATASQNWKRCLASVFNLLTVKILIKVLQRSKGNRVDTAQSGYAIPPTQSFSDTENYLLSNRQQFLEVELTHLP